MEYVIGLWIMFGIVCAIAAATKGRSVFGWLILGSILGVFGIVILAFLPTIRPQENAAEQTDRIERKCPECGELVLAEARKCKHCGSTIEPLALDSVVLEQIGPYFAKPDDMSIGEYQEKFLEKYKALKSPNGYTWRGTTFPSFAEMQDAIKMECSKSNV
jgi:hypothetical protein